jgi:putative ABC transport system substrate-binding protein
MRRREFIGSLIGTAVAWPLAASAQQPAKVYRLAIVSPAAPVERMNEGASGWPTYKALFGELRRLGYIEGQNLIVERYSGGGRTAHYAELASEVVRQQPDLIYTTATRIAALIKAVTSTIPIVINGGDPVAFGIVDSLARTGGNVTGVGSSLTAGPVLGSQSSEICDCAKRLGFLRELIPTASRVGYLAVDGGLMSYGIDLRESWRRGAIYVDKILKGAKPGNLPVELPTKFELVINMKTAKALGITIPTLIMERADEVIE